MKRAKILIADDDRLIVATLAKGLHNAGYSVVEAGGGEEATDLGLSEAPDLALLDYRMPGCSGIQVAHRLAQAGVPSLFLSAYHDAESVNAAIGEGALGYLVKPVNLNQLIPAIETALQRAADMRSLRDREERLSQAVKRDREVSTAVGIIMERIQVSAEEAYQALRGYARSQRRSIKEVAGELLDATARSHALLNGISVTHTVIRRGEPQKRD